MTKFRQEADCGAKRCQDYGCFGYYTEHLADGDLGTKCITAQIANEVDQERRGQDDSTF